MYSAKTLTSPKGKHRKRLESSDSIHFKAFGDDKNPTLLQLVHEKEAHVKT